ncbi:MAG: hypothetical protein QXR87_06990 [Candidatus Hadarchaeales archaeon]
MKFVVRKLGSAGDTCVVLNRDELAERLRSEFSGGYLAAIRAEGDARGTTWRA